MPVTYTYPYTQYGGIWKLNAASAAQGAGTWPRPPSPIAQYFSTTLYTGNGSTQTITNGIDLAGEGGMVWIKLRSAIGPNAIQDTVRGATNELVTNSTVANTVRSASLTSFNTNGFTLGSYGNYNASGETYASWTFRKAPKFFDVVTYTGDGTSNRQINHSLSVAPGMMIVKCTSNATDWIVYNRSLGATKRMFLDTTDSASTNSLTWNDTEPTSTNFTVGSSGAVNGNGLTYVAYLFAHDTAGNGVIQCGSLPDTAGAVANLGWQPQYILWKKSGSSSYWYIFDSARGMTSTEVKTLSPNSANAELTYTTGSVPFIVTPTGFTWQYSGWDGTAGADAIYMAIRDPNS